MVPAIQTGPPHAQGDPDDGNATSHGIIKQSARGLPDIAQSGHLRPCA
jgi:hypothetical protein